MSKLGGVVFEVTTPAGKRVRVMHDGSGYAVVEQPFDKEGNPVVKDGKPFWRPVRGAYAATLLYAVKRVHEEGLCAADQFGLLMLTQRMDAWTQKLADAVRDRTAKADD